jgi:hypothetical protein
MGSAGEPLKEGAHPSLAPLDYHQVGEKLLYRRPQGRLTVLSVAGFMARLTEDRAGLPTLQRGGRISLNPLDTLMETLHLYNRHDTRRSTRYFPISLPTRYETRVRLY